MSEVTDIIDALDCGDPHAAERLLPLVYQELRKMAARFLSNEPPGQTLQATALVHEAYLRLVGSEMGKEWNGRRHFFCSAAEAMRRILIENARRKRRVKHGGGVRRVDLDIDAQITDGPTEDLIALEQALQRLAKENPRVAQLVKLRYFAGLTVGEAAEVIDVSRATAERDWAYAKSWLYCELRDEDLDSEI